MNRGRAAWCRSEELRSAGFAFWTLGLRTFKLGLRTGTLKSVYEKDLGLWIEPGLGLRSVALNVCNCDSVQIREVAPQPTPRTTIVQRENYGRGAELRKHIFYYSSAKIY